MSAAGIDRAQLTTIIAQFLIDGQPEDVDALTLGHINDSYVVRCVKGASSRRYVLQRINSAVFADPLAVMGNVERVTAHIAARLAAAGVRDRPRRCLTLVRTRDDRAWHTDEAGGVWRMYDFIEGTQTIAQVRGVADVRAAGRAFGEFAALLGDLPPPRLHEIIPRFHDTVMRLEQFEAAVAADRAGRVAVGSVEIAMIRKHRGLAPLLLDLLASGAIPERIAHNDAKISNVLFDESGPEALCIVDLDTVMPGLALFDFGDMVRSLTCRAAEDEPDIAKVAFDRSLFEALQAGYLESAGAFLNAAEIDHLLDAGRVIVYEQAVRFLTDFLNGDRYYRTIRAGQNLERARVQLALLETIR